MFQHLPPTPSETNKTASVLLTPKPHQFQSQDDSTCCFQRKEGPTGVMRLKMLRLISLCTFQWPSTWVQSEASQELSKAFRKENRSKSWHIPSTDWEDGERNRIGRSSSAFPLPLDSETSKQKREDRHSQGSAGKALIGGVWSRVRAQRAGTDFSTGAKTVLFWATLFGSGRRNSFIIFRAHVI